MRVDWEILRNNICGKVWTSANELLIKCAFCRGERARKHQINWNYSKVIALFAMRMKSSGVTWWRAHCKETGNNCEQLMEQSRSTCRYTIILANNAFYPTCWWSECQQVIDIDVRCWDTIQFKTNKLEHTRDSEKDGRKTPTTGKKYYVCAALNQVIWKKCRQLPAISMFVLKMPFFEQLSPSEVTITLLRLRLFLSQLKSLANRAKFVQVNITVAICELELRWRHHHPLRKDDRDNG